MDNKIVVIFVEGYTEIEFYKRLVDILKGKSKNKSPCKVITKNLKGIGNYDSDILRKMKREIIPKYHNCQFSVMICYDTDAFEFAKKPPMDKKALTEKLYALSSVSSVDCIEAKKSIEDWFLLDRESLISSIGLPKDTKIKGTGIEELKRLFRLKNKTYTKGSKNYNFVDSLNIEKIACEICDDISPLCKELGVNCAEKKSENNVKRRKY